MTLPIKYKEVLNLQRLGVKQESIKFTNVTMNSSDTIIVNDNQSLSIVNTSKPPPNFGAKSVFFPPVFFEVHKQWNHSQLKSKARS
jgi:hypothetical protein